MTESIRTHGIRAATTTLVILMLTASSCQRCGDGELELQIDVRSPPYPRARCTQGKPQPARSDPRGAPITNAIISIQPLDRKVKTNHLGLASLRGIRPGEYTVQIVAPGFRPDPPRKIVVDVDHTAHHLTLWPCISAGAPRIEVGFDTPVTLQAETRCDSQWLSSIRWKQEEGPDISSSIVRKGRHLSFTTAALQRVRPLPETPRLLSFSHDQAGEYVFSVTATHPNGQTSRSYVFVSSTSVATGIPSVSPNQVYYLAGAANGPWNWTIIQQPPQWKVELKGQQSRTPSIRIVPNTDSPSPKPVLIREQHSRLTFNLTAGKFNLVPQDCGRSGCHASMVVNWSGTRHARSWKRLLDGETNPPSTLLAESCADCHSLGYDPYHDTGGYDDVARDHDVTVPQNPQAKTFSKLPKPVQHVSNVYCAACHGPGRLDPPTATQPGLFSSGLCARCHDRLPEQNVVAQWRLSAHSRSLHGESYGPATRSECAQCHTAKGFYNEHYALGRPHGEGTVVATCCRPPEPVTCQACHNPMLATYPYQLHRFGIRNDLINQQRSKPFDLGSAAICHDCHRSTVTANDSMDAVPHAPQVDIAYATGGFFFKRVDSRKWANKLTCTGRTPKGCVSCHMHSMPQTDGQLASAGGHSFRMKSTKGSPNIHACRSCHDQMTDFNEAGTTDIDRDGQIEGRQTEIDGLLTSLRRKINEAIRKKAYVGCGRPQLRGHSFTSQPRQSITVENKEGINLGDCDRNGKLERKEKPFSIPQTDTVLKKAIHNYYLVERDGSRGLHNYPFVVGLIQQTISAL